MHLSSRISVCFKHILSTKVTPNTIESEICFKPRFFVCCTFLIADYNHQSKTFKANKMKKLIFSTVLSVVAFLSLCAFTVNQTLTNTDYNHSISDIL